MAFKHLVTTDWLASRLDRPDLVIIDASWFLPDMGRDARAEYLQQRIPGAVFFDIDLIADTTSGLPHMLPRPEVFSSAMRKMGIGDGQQIVVYDALGIFSAPRVWWTFRVMGVSDVYVLDGGLPKWIAEERELEDGPPTKRLTRHFTARLNQTAVASLTQVQAALTGKSATVIDARPANRFRGDAPEPRPGVRAGHMPGAVNVPFPDLVTDGQLNPPEVIASTFDAVAGVGKPIITSCGSGVTAALLALALAEIDRTDVALYDGSWAEWGTRTDTEVVTGD